MADIRIYVGRFLESELRSALADTRVVGIFGARQSGKSTLARRVSGNGAQYVTFDDLATRDAANADPTAFVTGLNFGSIIDEIQRVPDTLSVIKMVVDEDPRPGRFILTGSANLLTLPRISESLAGRIQIFTLFPFAQAELEKSATNFVDRLFEGEFKVEHAPAPRLPERVLKGGYPEAVAREGETRRSAWFESYVTTMLQRDVREISAIEDTLAMNRVLRIAAARTAGLLNETALSSQAGIPRKTLSRYLAILEQLYLVWRVPAYARERGRRMTKSPKLYVNDTGLAAHLAGVDVAHLANDRNVFGGLLETFVANELRAQASWSRNKPSLFHYREHDGAEVDLILERRDGKIAAIETKAAASLSANAFSGLQRAAKTFGKDLASGVLLYNGTTSLAFGTRLWAMPIADLWNS
jgi:predicted AAA+ superfamily ATPase